MRKKNDSHELACMRREFGSRLQRTIKDSGRRQYEVAEKIGIAPSVISQYVAGRATPEVITLLKLCNELNVSADYLLCLDTAKPDNSMQTRHYRNLLKNVFHVLNATAEGIDKVVHVES